MLVPPIYALLLLLAVYAGVVAFYVLRQRARRRMLQLASRWNMRYVATDQMQLAARAGRALPFPGGAHPRARDVIYATREGQTRLVFTVEVIAGVVLGKHPVRRVACITEPASRRDPQPPLIQFAPAELPVLAQYVWLLERFNPIEKGETG